MTLILYATYKVILYDVPLFFVTVFTKVGYTVAAKFIVQSETSEDRRNFGHPKGLESRMEATIFLFRS